MLAKLTHDYFDHSDWVFERKLDGQRCLIFKKGDNAHLFSRNRNSQDAKFPELLQALKNCSKADFIADGEIVAMSEGVSSFSKLQPRIHAKEPRLDIPVFLYLFDLMHFDSHDLTKLPLRQRKQLLRDSLTFDDPLRFTPHRNESGLDYYSQACEKGWEGIIAKDAGSPYLHSRSTKWLKFKCENRQEFVVGGYTEPQGERIGFGALLLGFYKDSTLRYAGKVGTGFDHETLSELSQKIQAQQTEQSPFANFEVESKDVHWIEPRLVAEVSFTEWTSDEKLRHPSFLGLRADKEPSEVVKE